MKSFKKSVSIQKFSKNVRIHFAVGNCKGNYFNKEIWVLLNISEKKKFDPVPAREIAEVQMSGKTYSGCQAREKS